MTSEQITATATLIAAIGVLAVAVIGAITNSRRLDRVANSAEVARVAAEKARLVAEATKKEIIATRDGVYEIGPQLDGRLTQLIESIRKEGEAQIKIALETGRAEGKQSERDRQEKLPSKE